MIIIYILIFLAWFYFCYSIIKAYIKNKNNEKTEINKISGKYKNVKCEICNNQVSNQFAETYSENYKSVCHDCIKKAFKSNSDFNTFCIYNKDVPSSNFISIRNKAHIVFMEKYKSNDWKNLKNIVLINEKEQLISPFDDGVNYAQNSFYSPYIDKKINIKDILSIKLEINWMMTDDELQRYSYNMALQRNAGKNIAISYELFGNAGIANELSKLINTSEVGSSRVQHAWIIITTTSGEIIKCFIKPIGICDIGTSAYSEFIANCEYVQSFILNAKDKLSEENKDTVDIVESLKRYKELVDLGLMSEEEYDAKRKKILDL